MRRKERETSREEALAIFDESDYSVFATVNPDGSPYCVPVSAARAGETVYIHCAMEGKKLANLAENPSACLSAVSSATVIEKKYTVDYASALLTGKARLVTDEPTKRRALKVICERFCASDAERHDNVIAAELPKTAVVEFIIEGVTGKRNRVK